MEMGTLGERPGARGEGRGIKSKRLGDMARGEGRWARRRSLSFRLRLTTTARYVAVASEGRAVKGEGQRVRGKSQDVRLRLESLHLASGPSPLAPCLCVLTRRQQSSMPIFILNNYFPQQKYCYRLFSAYRAHIRLQNFYHPPKLFHAC